MNDNGSESRTIIYAPLIVFLPMSVIIIFALVLSTNDGVSISLPSDISRVSQALHEAGQRIFLLGVATLYCGLCFCVAAKAIWDITKLPNSSSKRGLALSLLILYLVAIYLLAQSIPESKSMNMELIGLHWFEAALDNEIIGNGWNIEALIKLLNITAVFTAIATPSLIVGTISTLYSPGAGSPAEDWKLQAKKFQLYILMCSVTLVIGVILFKSWISYPTVLVQAETDAGTKAGINAIANALTMFTGITYTSIFASFALPVAYFLSKLAETIALEALIKSSGKTKSQIEISATNVTKKRKEDGLEVSFVDMIKSLIALLAPLLTGAITGMLSAIS